MKITLNSCKFTYNYGEIVIDEVSPLELVASIDYTDQGIIEVLSAIADLKGKGFIMEVINE